MREKLIEIIKNVNENVIDYKGNNMIEDGIIDSLELMEIIDAIEENLGIEIDADDIVMENFMNIDSIVALITKMCDSN